MGAQFIRVEQGVSPGEDIGQFLGTEPSDVAWFKFGQTALSGFPIGEEVAIPIAVDDLIKAGVELIEGKICLRAVVNLAAVDRGDVRPTHLTPLNGTENDMENAQYYRRRRRGE